VIPASPPPITATWGAAVEQAQQLPAGGVPVPGPFGLELDQAGETGRRRGLAQGGRVTVELGQVFGGQVDAAVAVIFADVAQDVRQLKGDAERVGQPGGLARVVPRAEDPEREAADRACHASAVPQQVIDGLVGIAPHVGHAAVDELAERRHGHREVPLHVGQGEQHRIICGWRGEVKDLAPGRLQGGELLLGRHGAVADVVDPAGERVDDGQAAPLGRRQQPDPVSEVPGL
jgi:hypothetical protein